MKQLVDQDFVKYSEIREILKFQERKAIKIASNELASFSHFLQNQGTESAAYYKQAAESYLEELGVAEEPPIQYRLPIKWDIPFPPPKDPKFTFIDLFAGIGGFRLAFQAQGGKCVFTSEWDKFSQRTYEANFGEIPFGDIQEINELNIPDHDILCAGFPCQPFSLAGVSKKNSLGRAHGFLDETQGTLFFDIVRILDIKRPKAFLLENVKNLVSHDKGRTFRVIRETLEKLDYTITYKVMDGKHFVPQHRERIFIAGFDNRVFGPKHEFEFPALPDPVHIVKDILEDEVDPKYTLSDKLWQYLRDYAKKHQEKGNGFGYGLADFEGITRTISARYHKDGSEILIPQEGQNPRRLTPRECARLQGYPDTFVIPVSDTQAYRQFGNSVVMPLVKHLASQISASVVEK